MNQKPKPQMHRWQFLLLVFLVGPLFIIGFPVAVVVFALYLIGMAFLYLIIWALWNTRGKDILFVYSDSPIWQEYVETQILPRIASRAVILNWSQRKKWRLSFARFVFINFGGYRAFNPLGVVFHPWCKGKVFRFWQPFRDYKHGNTAALEKMQKEFFETVGIQL